MPRISMLYEIRYTDGSSQMIWTTDCRKAQVLARRFDPKIPPRITKSVWLLCDKEPLLKDPELATLAKAEGETP